MEPLTLVLLLLACALILGGEFVNGWTDAPNALAPLIATRVTNVWVAIVLGVCFNILGTLAGTAVAETIGRGIVDPKTINLLTVSAALVGMIVWGSIAARYGIPTSESHALVAGLSGAGLATAGPHALLWTGWSKVLVGIVASLILGFATSWILGKAIKASAGGLHPRSGKRIFDWLQIGAGCGTMFAHGMGDGQKFMGMFTLALLMSGVLTSFHIPLWVKLTCAGVMGLGTAFGGREIIATFAKISPIQSWQGFAALTASAGGVIGAASLGIPTSTTHFAVWSLTGAGACRHPGLVRWKHPRRIMYAAVLTFPICGLISFVISAAFQVFRGFL